MKPMKFGVGQAVKRVEDPRLITGRGNYTSDYWPQGTLHAAFLRSPHAHARFSFSDLETARGMPGVKAVYTLKDFSALGPLPCLAPLPNSDKSQTPLKPCPVMADGEAFHVGDIVAMAVAESEREARDAVEAIGVDWEPLEAVIDMEAAIADGAPLLFAEAPRNIAYVNDPAATEKTKAVFAK